MNCICAWCSKTLRAAGSEAPSDERMSHGICDECALTFVGIRRLRIGELLKHVSVPVLVLSADCRVAGANPEAGELFEKHPETFLGRLPGEVIDCIGACTPGGCGHSVICPACELRRTVEATARDGIPRRGLLSQHRVPRGNVESQLQFRFSTASVGEKVVVNLDHPARVAVTADAAPLNAQRVAFA